MRRPAVLLFVAAILPAALLAVEPEACLLAPGARNAIRVDYQGKTYHLASPECRELFITDPERYSQLFDALAELGPERSSPPPQGRVSLVPN